MSSDNDMLKDIIIEIDLSEIDDSDYQSDGWAIIHLTPDGEYIKGLHYVEDHEFVYTEYIPENDIDIDDMIMYGNVQDRLLKITKLLK